MTAIKSIDANAQFSISADGEVTFISTAIPNADIVAQEASILAWWNSTEYARLRKVKYDLLNQDEMRYDDVKNGTNTWITAIDAIKAQHPKPL